MFHIWLSDFMSSQIDESFFHSYISGNLDPGDIPHTLFVPGLHLSSLLALQLLI